MRFSRADLPGLALATLIPPALVYLFLASFELWRHEGTPLIPNIAVNVAIPAAIFAVFSRYFRHWDLILGLLGLMVVVVAGVNWAQRTGNDGTAIATTLKWIGVIDFMVINLVLVLEILNYAVLPWLNRRDERKAQQSS